MDPRGPFRKPLGVILGALGVSSGTLGGILGDLGRAWVISSSAPRQSLPGYNSVAPFLRLKSAKVPTDGPIYVFRVRLGPLEIAPGSFWGLPKWRSNFFLGHFRGPGSPDVRISYVRTHSAKMGLWAPRALSESSSAPSVASVAPMRDFGGGLGASRFGPWGAQASPRGPFQNSKIDSGTSLAAPMYVFPT